MIGYYKVLKHIFPRKMSLRIKITLGVLVLAVLVLTFPITARARAFIVPFGGKIIEVIPMVCLLPAPPPVFAIPFSGLLITVGPPVPTVTFFTPGLSRLYAWYSLLKGNMVLGISTPMPWLNCPQLVINKIGTSKPK